MGTIRKVDRIPAVVHSKSKEIKNHFDLLAEFSLFAAVCKVTKWQCGYLLKVPGTCQTLPKKRHLSGAKSINSKKMQNIKQEDISQFLI